MFSLEVSLINTGTSRNENPRKLHQKIIVVLKTVYFQLLFNMHVKNKSVLLEKIVFLFWFEYTDGSIYRSPLTWGNMIFLLFDISFGKEVLYFL